MDCNEFKKCVYDYLEGSLRSLEKEEFEKHILYCEDCRAKYEAELLVDKLLKNHFSLKEVNFTSSRVDIINSIDRNKFKKSKLSKLHFHFKRKEKTYAAYAAAILILFMITPYLWNNLPEKFAHNGKSNVVIERSLQKSSAPETVDSAVTENIRFGVEYLDDNTAFPINSSWRKSSNLEICLDNSNRILVYDSKTNKKWRISINKAAKNSVIKYFEWKDEANILVIVGNSGTESSLGGVVYNVQAYKGIDYLFYKSNYSNEEVIRITKTSENSFLLELADYSDVSRKSFVTVKKEVTIDESGMINGERIVK